MKVKSSMFLLLLAAGVVQAQNPNKVNSPATSPESECGPIGCLAPSATQTSQTPSGAPVVIRGETSTTPAAGTVNASSNNPVAPPSAPNDFQQFVHSSLGHDLPVFGSGLFLNSGTNFAPSSGAAPPADYVLGTGDQILVRTWGKIDLDVHATVDRNGQIFIPRVGALTVSGLRLDRLSDFINNAISQQFTGFQLSVSLGQLRSIQIFVLGHARAPGLYTLGSLTTLINALFTSGGPSSTGTLRDIQLKRDGQVISHFDVYQLLLAGDKSGDMRLLPGDIIFIPPLGAQVALDGDLSVPAIYEVRPGATVGSVITDAGGLTPVAETTRAVLERVLNHAPRSIQELALDANGLSTPVEGGDILRVFPVSPKIANAVTLRGNVAQTGRYTWHPGLRISDIIPSRDFLLTRAYYNRQNALDVTSTGDPFSSSPGNDTPTTATHDTEIDWNYAVIERLDRADLTTHLVPFALGEAISNPASAENKELQSGDVIVVYSRNDLALPLELQAKFVRIDGQVKAPGIYRVGPDETLRDLVTRAGGLVPHAYLYAARLTRESVRLHQEAQLKTIVARESQDILSPSNQRLGTSGLGNTDLDLRKAYVAELAKIQPDGRVVLRMSADSSSIADVPAMPLEDGDHFFVPTTPNTVDVLGTVYNSSALSFTAGAHANTYLDEAGGATRDGDRKREFVIRANGMLVSRQSVSNFSSLVLNPGDALVVPPKLKPGLSAYDLLNFTQIISTFSLSALAIEALR